MISPRTLLLFYMRHLRVQPLRELMAVLGVAAGVALLFSVQVANSSVTGSFREVVRGVAGRASLELDARAPEGFPEGVTGQVARTAGVRSVAPILEQRIVAAGPAGRRALLLVGADERLAELGGRLAVRFQQAGRDSRRGLLVMTEPDARAIGARPGGVLAVKVGARTEHLALAASVTSAQVGPLAASPLAATSLPIAQSLSGQKGRISRILVAARPGRARQVQAALTRRYGATLNVRRVGAEASLLADAARPEGQLTALFSLISLVVGVVLAYNAILLASSERRSFIAHLTQLGAPDLALVATLAFDTCVLGIAGSAVGLALGDFVSLLAYHSVPGYLAAAFAIGDQRVLTAQTIEIAVAAGMLAAFAAAALPAVGLLRANTAEMGTVSRLLSLVGRPRWADSVSFLGGGTLVCLALAASLMAPTLSVVALVSLVAGVVVCMPMTVRCMLGLARAASRRSSDPAARLSVAELQVSPARSVALVATGAIAVFLMVTIGGAVADVQRAVKAGAGGVVSNADLWLNPSDADNVYSTEPFAYGETARRLRRLSEVSSVTVYRQSFLDLPSRRVWVIGVPARAPTPIVPSQLVDGSLASAARDLRAGGWAAISQALAAQRGLRIGERFSLPTPSGNASFRLAATISNYGWLPGTVLLGGADYARLWRSTQADQLAVTLNAGVTLAEGKAAVQAALPPGSALTVQSDAERQAQVSSVLGSTLSRLNQTSAAVLIAAIATVIAMMVSAVWQRRGRLDALLSIGMSYAQLARLLFYESGLVLLAGCTIGMFGGLLGQDLVDSWLHHSTGSPVRFAPAWPLGVRTILLASAISVVVALVAVVRTVGLPAKTALTVE